MYEIRLCCLFQLNEDKKDAESGDGNDNDKKDGEDYAELDQNALNTGPRYGHTLALFSSFHEKCLLICLGY